MKKVVFSLFASFLTNNVNSQPTFQFRYGNTFRNDGDKVVQTFDGNFVVAGNTRSSGAGTNAFLMKVNTIGSILWQKNYIGNSTDSILDLIQLPNRHLVFCGSTWSFGAGDSDGFITEVDSAGNVIWSKRYGTPNGHEYFMTISPASGGFYVSGRDTMGDAKSLLKLNSSGSLVWGKQWTSNPSEFSHHLTLMNGGVYFAAQSSAFADIISYKFDQAGSLLWSRQYTSYPATINFNSIFSLSAVESGNGNLILATAFSNSLTSSGNDQVVLAVDSTLGNQLWSKSYGGSGHEETQKIIRVNNEGYAFISKTVSNGLYGTEIAKINNTGNLLWCRRFQTPHFDLPNDINLTSANGFVFTGASPYPYSPNADSCKVYLGVADSTGLTCTGQTWTLVTNDQSFTLTTPPAPTTYTCPINSFNWTMDNQPFGPRVICSTAGVEELENESSPMLYPNPTSGKIKIQNVLGENLNILIYNSLGQLIKEVSFEKASSNVEINIQEAPEGVYKLIVTSPNHYRTSTVVKLDR